MDKVLFCPFCGEAFEGQSRCPEHELPLLPWAALPKPQSAIRDHDPRPWHSPGLGRAWVAMPAALILLAFVSLPIARVDGALHMGGSMLRLALHNAPRLWLVPAAACAELLILYRRRSPASMRGARLAVLCVGCVPALTVAWTWLGANQAVGLLAARTQVELRLQIGSGAYLVWLATLPLLLGGFRFGTDARRQASVD